MFVEVFNNTRTKGLAGGVAEKAKAAGWNVVGSDNWYGTVDGTSVYFPPRLKEAARELGRDLGIKHLRPAEEPMRFDRVTVILTDDYTLSLGRTHASTTPSRCWNSGAHGVQLDDR